MNALEQQAQASESFWGTVAGVPREEPLSDAQVESAEMRSGTGTALQQTSFGRATDPAAPQLPEQEQRPLSDWEMEELEDQTVRDPSYIPTFNEWDSWDQKRAARSNAVNGFFQGAGSIASALGGVVWSLGKLPGDFVFRGFGPAYDTMVHSLAEGARRSGVGLAEIINYAGDVYADSSSDIRRSAAINDKIRQQLAAENKFTGNAQQDEAILEQAINEARAAGLYGKTPEETAAQAQEDRKTAYDRFVRNRALEQEFLGIGNFTMGNDPIETGRIFGPKTVGGQPSQITAESVTKRAYGIDDSKVDEGLATFGMLALDPLAILPMGAGGLSKLRALRRISILADKPLGGVAKSAGWAATKAENLQDRLMRAGLTSDRLAKASFGVAVGSGALGFSQNNDVAKGIALAAAVLPAVRKSGGILRGVESAAQSGQMVVKEMGVGGVGVFRADSASRLADDAAIPGRYREAMRGFFSGPESSLKRASQNEGMSLRARRTLGALDNTGVTQAFRLADDAVSGGLAGAAVASPFALIAPEDQQSQIFGAIATMGAAGGLIGGPLARRTQMIDADIARMLADVDAAGGDAAYFSQLPHETLARYAAMQGVVSTKVDWVPLSAQDYAANLAMPAASRETTKGLFVDASDGNRPRVFLDIDQLASGDVAGHEIGHAILKSDILGGEIKNNMRNQVNVQYGQDGVQARGREYLASIMAREVEAGVTGLKPEVLTDAEMRRVANGASPEDIVRARWEDPQMRQRMIDERIEDKNQRDLAEGNMEWDWARDEIAAETFSGLSGGIDFRRMREGGPLAGMLGAASGLFDMMGAKFRGNGRLETPNRVFEENPLFDTPEMRRAVTNYTKQFERYLVGMERDSAPKKRGTKVAPTGKASEAARSPHNRVYQNGAVVENDIFILDANGNPMPKSQQQVNTQEKARAATLKSINTRTRLVPVHSAEWGARKVGNRVEVGGPNLPLQFDNFVQVPQWLRTKAREFEAGRRTGQSYRVSYNAIGTGASGSYKVSNLGNVEAITREVVPFGWQLSDKNHLLAKVIDLDAFRAAAIRAVDRGELPEFNNNVKDVEAGLKVLLKNHEDGLPGETNLGAQKKNLLNGLLGTGTPTQKAANPLYGDLNPKGSIRTFRFDRLNYADPFGTGYFPHYHKINTNALPREVGVMSLDEWRQFDADRKSAYLNQQAARRGYSNATNWQGADPQGFQAADAQYRQEFPTESMPQQIPREAQGMPDAVDALTTDQLLRQYEENQGYLGLSTLGMREGRPVRGGAAQTRELLRRNEAISAELERRGVRSEDPQLQRALQRRGQAMPDALPADAPPFYMKSTQVLDSKIQGKAATVDQVRAILTNPQNGIKAEELKWTGALQAAERLAKENNGKVPKEALLRYLQEDGAVRLEEVRMRDVSEIDVPAQWEQQRQEEILRARAEEYARQQGRSADDVYDEIIRDAAELSETMNEARIEWLDSVKEPPTKFGQYQLPGGENYREVVLAMPDPKRELALLEAEYKEINSGQRGPITREMTDRLTQLNMRKNQLEDAAFNAYTSRHFDTPNYVAHMRLNERTDAAGKRGLFLEEIQSDRHQAGREKGYREPFEQWIAFYDAGGTEVPIGYGRSEKQALESIDKNWEGLVKIETRKRDGVEGVIPDAPFRKDWPMQMFKRALADAVGNGKEWIGWTDGVTQVDRYTQALRQRVKSIEWTREDGLTVVDVKPQQGKRIYLPVKDGKIYRTADQQSLVGKDLSEVIGKEAAARVNEAASGKLTGENLTIGGEGMKGFYDQILPKEISKYVKQWGAQVEKSRIGEPKKGTGKLTRDEVSEARREAKQLIRGDISVEEFNDNWGTRLTDEDVPGNDPYREPRGVENVLNFVRDQRKQEAGGTFEAWRVNITPQMREGIKKAGQALFVGGMAAVVAEQEEQ
jgi:hypothetical protein